jgi:hypothetical protein
MGGYQSLKHLEKLGIRFLLIFAFSRWYQSSKNLEKSTIKFLLNFAFTVLLLDPDLNTEEKHIHTDLDPDLVNQHNKNSGSHRIQINNTVFVL